MRSVLAVSMTIGTRLNFLISRQTSNPSRDGSITSRITASKPPERAWASPCRPSAAVTTWKPAAFSPIDAISRIDASSSTSSRRSSTIHPVPGSFATAGTAALHEKCYFAGAAGSEPQRAPVAVKGSRSRSAASCTAMSMIMSSWPPT